MKSFAIALLLNEASALRLNSEWSIGFDGDEDLGEDIIIGGEPFHFRQKQTSMVQTSSPEDYIVKPREALPRKQWTEDNMSLPEERVSILEPVIARQHTTFYDKQNGLWRHNRLAQKKDPDAIAPGDYDPWVYSFSKDNMGAVKRQWHNSDESQ